MKQLQVENYVKCDLYDPYYMVCPLGTCTSYVTVYYKWSRFYNSLTVTIQRKINEILFFRYDNEHIDFIQLKVITVISFFFINLMKYHNK